MIKNSENTQNISIQNCELIADMIKNFAEKEIKPQFMQWDETQEFPIDLFRKLGEMGMMGVLVPEEYGGSGFGYHEYVTVVSEIAKIDGSIGLSVAAHNSLCTGHILQFGSEGQKQRWLPKLASGEWIGAWGLTEPNTGSDAGNMKTVARKDGDHWVINGTKNFITHGISGDLAVVMTRTGEAGDSHGMTAFVVERGTPGFSGGKKENKLGMRASETAEMIFDDCRVPEENILGEVGEGFVQALKILDGGRVSIAALGLGIAQGALDAAVAYAQERKQFNQEIAKFQGVSFKIADMATQVMASRLLIKQAAELKNQGKSVNRESAMAKLHSSETAVSVANDAVQIFGGYGYVKDFPVEKFYRDAKLCTIGEGTSEIQKLVISRTLFDKI
ncbi:acyl-CoA dehydrogenase family protein [Reichenbachiella sp. MSK19-1]|uniref:acyl-CoA dehydrogenase family protein n=1 Tax=Reichenbachiella sp. MSK19-1 TaxID=1897631 RepID=UPI000E6C8854|nr:acyl-CoA dehydrogenase family protein [Reichenbachiella sp. MSK19-1]RJE73004.1 acyl-CoA dehydrogenase [Reichenbachiella sp. MSK19-1]